MIPPHQLTRQTFPELLHRNASRFGERTAQQWRAGARKESLTYAQLAETVARWAGGLLSLGLAPGDRVGIMAATGPRWMWADYAILCGGGITVSLYPTLDAEDAAHMLRDAGARMVFVDSRDIAERIHSVRGTLPDLERILLLEPAAGRESAANFDGDELAARGVDFLAAGAAEYERRWRAVAPADPMTIVYTSGTTGRLKGVVHTHAGVNAACVRDIQAGPPLGEDDLLLAFLPLAHTYERQCGHGVAMQAAVPIAYSTPATLLRDLPFFQPTVFLSVPRMYERIYRSLREQAARSRWKHLLFECSMEVGRQVMIRRSDERGVMDVSDPDRLLRALPLNLRWRYALADRFLFRRVRRLFGGRFRFAFSAAGALPADLCRTFWAMGIRVYEGYGATETCNTVALNPPDQVLPGSVGRVCPGMETRIADDGEWRVRGEPVFREYWRNPEATRSAFDHDGFYRTGDIVEEAGDGFYRIVDRKHGLIVLDTGKNVPSAKLESRFSLSEFVQTVVPVGDGRKFIAAIVVPQFERCLEHFDQQHIPYDRRSLVWRTEAAGTRCVAAGPEVTGHPALRRLLDQDIEAVNRTLPDYEQIKAYVISPRVLEEEKGEVTPTLKVRRAAVIRAFQPEIEALYR